jgi:hypothetical protein
MIPVIFIHWSDSFYLSTSVSCARAAGNNVILLKDCKYDMALAEKFDGSLEVIRWFMLLEYMEQFDIERCLYLDSDCLLFKEIKDEFSEYDIAISKNHCGHVTFINNIQILRKFCQYMMDSNLDTVLIDQTRKSIPDGVFPDTLSDMVLLNNFVTTIDSVGDISKIRDESVYDHNINVSDGYEMNGPTKRILFHKQVPYGMYDERLIRFNSLHLQGAESKHRMEFYNKYE